MATARKVEIAFPNPGIASTRIGNRCKCAGSQGTLPTATVTVTVTVTIGHDTRWRKAHARL